MARDKVLLLVDLSYQSYRATSTHLDLRSHDGTFTGGVYGFLVALARTIIDSNADHVVVCQDVKPYVRSKEYPEYKMLRRDSAKKDKRAEEIREKHLISVPLIIEAMHEVGIPLLGIQGFESDDCIGYIVRQHSRRWKRIYAASNDSDLFALLKYENFSVWPKSEKGTLMTLDWLRKTHLMEPDEFSLATALTGTHNDIEGIPRVGPVTARKVVQTPGLLRKYREEHGALIDRNLRLIRLPHEQFPHVAVPERTRRFNSRAFVKWCSMYDITTTRTMDEAFEQVSPR